MKIGLLTLVAAGLMSFAGFASAEKVEIALTDKLDTTTNEYCFDIMGGGQNVDPSRGLQAHTCYSYRGELGPDQAVATADLENGQFNISDFDVCVTMSSLEEGASVALTACDGSELQQFDFDFAASSHISPVSAPNMCVTIGDETSYGMAVRHQIRTLSLETCSDELASRQNWFTRDQETYNASIEE